MSGLLISNFSGAASVHYHNGLPYDENGALLVSQESSYTWSTKPVYSTVAVGVVVNITDVGGTGGSYWRATAAGWVPFNGSVVLAQAWGTVAAPVATIAGSTGALFVPSGGAGSLVIPAGAMIATRSVLRISAIIHRRGANATAVGRIYIGTAGTSSDSSVYGLSYAATDTLQARPEVDVAAVSSSAVTSSNYLAAGNTGTAPTVTVSPTTNINLAADMTISFGISAANALDSFDLIAYSVMLRSL